MLSVQPGQLVLKKRLTRVPLSTNGCAHRKRDGNPSPETGSASDRTVVTVPDTMKLKAAILISVSSSSCQFPEPFNPVMQSFTQSAFFNFLCFDSGGSAFTQIECDVPIVLARTRRGKAKALAFST